MHSHSQMTSRIMHDLANAIALFGRTYTGTQKDIVSSLLQQQIDCDVCMNMF